MGFLFSVVEMAIALVDYFTNVEPLHRSFTQIMASFGGAGLNTGIACVSVTNTVASACDKAALAKSLCHGLEHARLPLRRHLKW